MVWCGFSAFCGYLDFECVCLGMRFALFISPWTLEQYVAGYGLFHWLCGQVPSGLSGATVLVGPGGVVVHVPTSER